MRLVTTALVFGLLLSLMIPPAAAGESPAVDPRADRVLKQMSDYLASRKQLTVQAEASHESLLEAGQKLMFVGQAVVSLKRPDRNVSINGRRYYQCGGTYYQPVYDGPDVVYVVVQSPR